MENYGRFLARMARHPWTLSWEYRHVRVRLIHMTNCSGHQELIACSARRRAPPSCAQSRRWLLPSRTQIRGHSQLHRLAFLWPVPGRAPACLPHLSASSTLLGARYPEEQQERGSTRVMCTSYPVPGAWPIGTAGVQRCIRGEGKVEHPGLR